MDVSTEVMKQLEHSTILISESEPESEWSENTRQGEDEVHGSADPLANEFNPKYAETSTRRKQRSKSDDEVRDFANRSRLQMDQHEQFTSLVERRLKERRQIREINLSQGTNRYESSASIYKFPPKLEFGDTAAQQPEIVSIGPYHRGKDHLLEFEQHKWTFLDKFLSRSRNSNYMSSRGSLSDHMGMMMTMEERARKCYQHKSNMSSQDFVEMMLLDGCFTIVLLHLLGGHGDKHDEDEDGDFVFAMPWMIPLLNQDLLKMENQLPFFVLNYLFPFYNENYSDKYDTLHLFALDVFDLSFPTPLKIQRDIDHNPLHLLELVYLGLIPLKHAFRHPEDEGYRPSNQSIQSATQLRSSGIKFRPANKTASFLDIKYKKQVLEIPTITINDYTTCLLTNFIAWEQSHQCKSRIFTDYIAFMNFLISEPRDVAYLCADGIISRLSQDDASVATWFNCWRKVIVFNNRSSYLSKELGKLEAYYSSHWATVFRTYFSSPWSSISLFTAFLLIVCSLIQSIMSIVSYKAHPK